MKVLTGVAVLRELDGANDGTPSRVSAIARIRVDGVTQDEAAVRSVIDEILG